MQLRIVGIGKVKEPYLQEGLREYCTRIRPYFNVSLIDMPEEKIPPRLTQREREDIQDREAARMISMVRGSGIIVVLDVEGQAWSSEDLAAHLRSWIMGGQNTVSFLIGGPLGFPRSIHDSARYTLSLSRMTFPHQMVRLILIEQIYRAARICSGEPYHK